MHGLVPDENAWGRWGRGVWGAKRWMNPGIVGEACAAAAIMMVVVWNVIIHPEVMKRGNVARYAAPVVSTFNLNQQWNMFAPVPYYNDWWMVGMGLDWEGRILNLWSKEGMPETIQAPVDGADYYGSYRLRRSLHLAHKFNKMEHMLGYYCRTGDWQGIAIWTVWRRNLGSSATVNQPYMRGRKWWWKCDGANEEVVQVFYDEVLDTMEMGVEHETTSGLE